MIHVKKVKTNLDGQILIVTLLTLIIVAVIVVGVVATANRDVQQTVSNQKFQQVYNSGESSILRLIDKYGNPEVSPSELPIDFPDANCIPGLLDDDYTCTFIDEEGVLTELGIKDTNEVDGYELQKDDSFLVRLDGYRGDITMDWRDGIAMEFALFYTEEDGTVYNIQDLFDDIASPVFNISGDNPYSLGSPQHPFRFQQDPDGDKVIFTVDDITGLPSTGVTTEYIRVTARIPVGESTVLLDVSGSGLPQQVRQFTATSYDPESDVDTVAVVVTHIPLLPPAASVFNYALGTPDEIELQGRLVPAPTCPKVGVIDFESVLGASGYSAIDINTQFKSSHGVTFSLEGCGSYTVPRLARYDSSSLSAYVTNSRLLSSFTEQGGSYFTTDNFQGETGTSGCTFVVDFDDPVTHLSFDLADVDSSEIYTITGISFIGETVHSEQVSASSSGAGNHRLKTVDIDVSEGIAQLRISMNNANTDFGFDNFVPGCTDCGNGIVEYGETCDDGNTDSGDGCRYNCTTEVCGDGITDPQEDCDPNDTETELLSNRYCTNSCELRLNRNIYAGLASGDDDCISFKCPDDVPYLIKCQAKDDGEIKDRLNNLGSGSVCVGRNLGGDFQTTFLLEGKACPAGGLKGWGVCSSQPREGAPYGVGCAIEYCKSCGNSFKAVDCTDLTRGQCFSMCLYGHI